MNRQCKKIWSKPAIEKIALMRSLNWMVDFMIDGQSHGQIRPPEPEEE